MWSCNDDDDRLDNVIPFPEQKGQGSSLSRELQNTQQRFLRKFNLISPGEKSQTWIQFRNALKEIKKRKR